MTRRNGTARTSNDQGSGTALKLPERLRPPCPRGCVDVEGCGCDWNVEREAWPNGSALRLSGAKLIALERERQMAREGWTPKHDDIEHQAGELAAAAVAYATAPGSRQRMKPNGDPRIPDSWPWEPEWWKPKWTPRTGREGRIRELVIAGALLAAEIDRLQRDES